MQINKKIPYVLDDRCIISKEVQAMSLEERKREILRLEAAGKKERKKLKVI